MVAASYEESSAEMQFWAFEALRLAEDLSLIHI